MSRGVNTSIALAGLIAFAATPLAAQRDAPPRAATVTIISSHRLATFDPHTAWGAALDGHDYSETSTIYTPANIAAMLSAGLGPISYRLRTELGVEVWHWNPHGEWSDAARHQGYWTSFDTSTAPITMSFGYRLPRRGRTIDDANNDSYSRLDDGDTTSFWKTNPYLDPRFTHDSEALHPQWFTVDLDRARSVREVRIDWGDPYPRRYTIEYWIGDQTQLIDDNPAGSWHRFPAGTVTDGHGGDADIVLAPRAVSTRFIRVVMQQSSHTTQGGNGDPRDSLGFAVREILVGARDARGIFHDAVRHDTVADDQSTILVSSTDPWHRASDIDSGTAQPGFDLVFRSGLTRGLPALVPVGIMYNTPLNAANELRFLNARGYPLDGIELGEEPDGQRVTPEDFAAFYVEFSRALRAADAEVRLGGPSFQTLLDDPLEIWPDVPSLGARSSQVGRFLDYTDAHHATGNFQFLSFEWYPFDDVCSDPARNLAAAPSLFLTSLDRFRAAGVPDSIPRIMTEYGYSAHLALAEVEMPAALFDADLIGNFFAHGGSQSFYFGYEPTGLGRQADCPHWGNLLMFLADSLGTARDRMPRYYAAWLLTHAWADSAGGEHQQYRVDVHRATPRDSLVSVFALRRPDGKWSLLLVNRDGAVAHRIAPMIAAAGGAVHSLAGSADLWQYSGAQYRFHEAGEFGHPVRDLPPSRRRVTLPATIALPPYSITVVTAP